MKVRPMALVLLGLLGATLLKCQIDCLDNSWHLTRKYDDKSYHHVSCTCPCDAYRAKGLYTEQRNRCLQCLHFHDPKPISISLRDEKKEATALSPLLMRRLIIEVKKRSNA